MELMSNWLAGMSLELLLFWLSSSSSSIRMLSMLLALVIVQVNAWGRRESKFQLGDAPFLRHKGGSLRSLQRVWLRDARLLLASTFELLSLKLGIFVPLSCFIEPNGVRMKPKQAAKRRLTVLELSLKPNGEQRMAKKRREAERRVDWESRFC